jgi:hypothetical protein
LREEEIARVMDIVEALAMKEEYEERKSFR